MKNTIRIIGVAELCRGWNNATNPAALRTDHEHHREGQRARAIKHRLTRLGARSGVHYYETANGKLWHVQHITGERY